MDINWNLFTKEEQEIIKKCIDNGDLNNITCLPNVSINTPEKEKEIEKIVLSHRGIDMEDESKVRDELNDFWSKGNTIQTPEEEAKWQEKLDKEEEEKKKLLEEEKNKLNSPITN